MRGDYNEEAWREERERPQSRRKGAGKGSVNLPGILITALFVLVEGWFFYRLLRLKMVPGKYMWIIAAGLVLLACLVGFLCWNLARRVKFIIGTVLAILLSAGMIWGSGWVDKFHDTGRSTIVETTAAGVVQTVQMGVYVMADSGIEHLEDLSGKILGIMEVTDRSEAEQVLDELSKSFSDPLQVRETYGGFAELIRGLYNGEIHAAVLEESFIEILSSLPGFEDIHQRVRKVTEHRSERPTTAPTTAPGESAASTPAELEETTETGSSKHWIIIQRTTNNLEGVTDDPSGVTEDPAQTSWQEQPTPAATTPAWVPPEGTIGTAPPNTQPSTAWGINPPAGQEGRIFTVYISGLDTRGGGLASRGNSDVNILAVVNMNTHQILLISTPRDFYVSFPVMGGAQDKLTHAGYYSVQASMDALRGLYGVSCQYYARIGFDGTVRLVDALGGVDVYSSYAFEAGSYHINAGTNHLNGAQALAFVRQRYNMPGGDRARGTNQMAMIKAIFQKMTSSSALSNLSEVLDAVGALVQTTMPYDTMAAIIRSILNGDNWNMASYSVNGSNGYNYCPSIGTEAFVMYPDYSTVSYAQSLIRQVYEGGWVSP